MDKNKNNVAKRLTYLQSNKTECSINQHLKGFPETKVVDIERKAFLYSF